MPTTVLTTLADDPRFYTENFVDEDASIVASSGQAGVSRLFDRDIELKWSSVGSNDATQESIEIEFRSGGAAFSRKIDRVFVFGHNLLNWELQYWDGAAWQSITVVAADTGPRTLISFDEVTTTKIRLLMNTTRIANEDKEIGEIKAMLSLLEINDPDGPAALPVDRNPVAVLTPMLAGPPSVHQTRWAGNRVDFYRGRIPFRAAPRSVEDGVLSVVRRGVFTVYPEPNERPDEIFEVTGLLNALPGSYTTTFKGTGRDFDLEMEEIA